MPGLLAIRPFAPGTKISIASPAPTAAAAQREKRREGRSPFRRLPQVQVPPAYRPSQNLACAELIRPKQVTDPLTETVRATLNGTGVIAEAAGPNYGSSGSDHEPSSTCLAAMVHEFMEEEQIGSCGRSRCNCLDGTCCGEACLTNDNGDSASTIRGEFYDLLKGVTSCTSTTELVLLSEVSKAMEAVAEDECSTRSNVCVLRSIMKHLRLGGYNAAVCKSRWGHTGGFPAGDYEYIDVLTDGKSGKSDRLIVDTDFKAQFEIARASRQYNALLQALPCIFVGRPERLQQILKIMSDAAKRSLRKKGLHLPPWRKSWYLQAKWFSAYKRTTNEDVEANTKPNETLSQEFPSIALKGPQFFCSFTEEMETYFYVKEGQQGLNKGKAAMDSDGSKQREEDLSCHGFVQRRRREGREMNVMSTGWQLPAVNPKARGRVEVVSGLATALVEAGICTLSSQNVPISAA